MWNVREESSMTRNESSPRSGTEATTEIEATCFLRGNVDFVDKHRTIHFAERGKERERDLDFLFLRALLDTADRVRASLEDRRR